MKKRLLVLGIVLLLAGCGSGAERYMEQAREYYASGRFNYASYNYIRVLELDRENKEAYLGLIDSYIKQERFEDALDYLEEAEFKFGAEVLGDRKEEIEAGILAAKPVNSPTSTPVPTATSTPMPTATSTPMPKPTSTPKPTPTSTPVPTAISTPKPTATSTPTPKPTSTPKPTPTSMPKPTPTSTPRPTPVAANDSDYWYNYEIVDRTVKITGIKEDYPTVLYLPGIIEGYLVTEIETGAFYECGGLKAIYLPESLERIGELAFYNCAQLERIELPYTLQFIGKTPFYRCSNLKKVIVMEGSYAEDWAKKNAGDAGFLVEIK